MQQLGVVILGHGSRAGEANRGMLEVVDQVKELTGLEVVEPAFLQLSDPGLPLAVERAVERGATRVVVVPLFLFNGVHVQQDIPRVMIELTAAYAGRAELVYAANLGSDPRIAAIVADRIREVG